MAVAETGLRYGENTANGITLHYAAMGRPDAPLIIMLHGFPEYWAGWRPVMERLADRFLLVAPDQRGYNRSSKPEGVGNYRAKHLVADIAALADALSPDRPFVLAGHDWGASVAYAYAFAHPQRLTHLVIANGVHPACFQRAIFEDPEQRQASQYMNWLRSPKAEEKLPEENYGRMMRMLAGFSDTQWMDEDEAAAYRDAWSEPGALTGMLNWYRASPVAVPEPGGPAPEKSVLDLPAEAMTVHMPHLVLWGEEDIALRPSCIEGLDRYAPQLTVRRVAGTGHWILHEKPDEVAAAIAGFVEN
ncbi:MAG: alpha/beta hydrolase [Rhizobiaceae bacterium]|nr:alpha/beta hydrolase [Rhizobiaceae bacterium]